MATNGSLNGSNLVRVGTAPNGNILSDPYGQLYGDAFAPPRDPLTGDSKENACAVYRDIPITALTGDWDPDGIKGALASHKIGMFAQSALLVDDAFGDDRVQATLGSRSGALFGRPLVHKRSGSDTSGECYKAWRAQWKSLGSQAALSEIHRWGVMLGFGVAEILWDTSVTPWRQYLKPWHPQFIYYRWDIRRFVASTIDGPVVIEPGSGKWFVYAPFGQYRGWMHGAVRAIADKWLIKQYAWRDWARFNERHGLPMIKAYVPSAGDPEQKANFVASMASIGQESVVGLPVNVDGSKYDVELLEARDRAWESFQGTINRADSAIVLTIKWQNLTTEVKEGSFAAARVHGDVEQVACEFDSATFAHDFYQQVARPFAAFNFGDPDAAPYSHYNVEPVEDYVASSRTLQTVTAAMLSLREAGFEVKRPREFMRRYGIQTGPLRKVQPLIGGGAKTSVPKEPKPEEGDQQ